MKITAKIGGGKHLFYPTSFRKGGAALNYSSISPKGGLRRKGGEPHG